MTTELELHAQIARAFDVPESLLATETVPAAHISSRFARGGHSAPCGGVSDAPSSRPTRFAGPMFSLSIADEAADWDETAPQAGDVLVAPAGTDPILGEGWTDLGWVAEGGLEFADIPVVTHPCVPRDTWILGSMTYSSRVWPSGDGHSWWHEGGWAYGAVDRIAMTVQRHDVEVTAAVPTIGYPPLKAHGVGGRRYRAARRAYARRRKAWKRAGRPTYPIEIRFPNAEILKGMWS